MFRRSSTPGFLYNSEHSARSRDERRDYTEHARREPCRTWDDSDNVLERHEDERDRGPVRAWSTNRSVSSETRQGGGRGGSSRGGRYYDDRGTGHSSGGFRGRGAHLGGERGRQRGGFRGRGIFGDGERGHHNRGYRGRGRGGRRDGLNLTLLEELREKDPSTIVMTLGLDSGIDLFLKRESLNQREVYAFVSVLAKACRCTTAPESFNRILLSIRESQFYEHVSGVLRSGARGFSVTEEEKKNFLGDLAIFMKELYIRLPHSAMEMRVLGFEDLLTKEIHKMQSTSDDIPRNILSNITALQELKKTVLDQSRSRAAERDDHKEGGPPDDFRDVSIFPNADDIHPSEKPFLRKNKSVGGYRDLDHYLDVQFRLLREDFICPLREGIEAYLVAEAPGKRGQRLKDIRVYHDVHIVRTLCSNNGLLHRLSFDVSNLQRVRWENSKRLIYGSLLCLSKDNFKTLLFATITERDPKLLKEGCVDVLFEASEDLDKRHFDTKFVMVETTAFFEAYRHVLRGLQNIKEGDLPFEKYIVACENAVNPPKYLSEANILGKSPKFDLRPLIDDKIDLREDKHLRTQGREVSYFFSHDARCGRSVHVLEDRDWPSPETLHVDMSQFQALKTALTKEFSIIQGPPGTGKTYVGLKIVKALLHNDQMWKKQQSTPMLVVCYTNHALDQFLEGIIRFYKGGVIRVGSRISNEELERYSLRTHRQKMRKDRDKDRDMKNVGKRRWETKNRMLDLQYQIEEVGMKLEAAEKTVLHEDVLKPYMKSHYDTILAMMKRMHRQQEFESRQKLPFPRSFIVEWLGVGSMEATMETFGDQRQDAFQLEYDDEEGDEIDVQEEAGIVQAQRKVYDMDTDDFPTNEFEIKQKKIRGLQNQRNQYVALDVASFDKNQMPVGTGTGFQYTKKARKNIKRRMLKQLKSTQRMHEMEARRVRDPWMLTMEDRWRLYRHWVYKFCERLQKDIHLREQSYKEVVAEYKELQVNEDMQILREATVIGMTTTAAARYQQALTEIGPRIIVVEEAAEVLEGHIISTLSKKCEQLILIGDHKQLKPNPTVYNLAKKFNLDLSLFERMIDNGIHCDTLALQHRMRPEISTVMRHIYPKLQDHPSVFHYENVKGISANMFFIDHSNQEEHDADMMSHSNTYEATYIVALCSYLLKQGYDKSRITVLTTYSGQLLKLKKLMPKQEFQGLRLTVVDNYQGEENDIILLSLVRSNAEGSVGFLKIENRICVALSRAKIGLFVIGNFNLLSQQSLLWKDILADLRKNGKVGPALNLYCQNHPSETGICVQSPDDFKKAPEGGCLKPCVFRLECGHVCTLLCHPYDPEHKDYICRKQCTKHCKNGHQCPRYCHEECGNCMIRVEKIIPKCQHKQMVPCFKDPSTFSCQAECNTTLDCGHTCGNPCSMKHGCTAVVKKTFGCGHTGDVLCARKTLAQCEAKCPELLKCGHKCEGDCTRCHEGRLHIPCRKMCKGTLICEHTCVSGCSQCNPCRKACENRCQHATCTKYCGEPCDPCSQQCTWECEHYRCTLSCSEPCDRPPCNEPCKEKLPCKHPCIGLCGEPCPKQCGICNKDEIMKVNPRPGARFVFLEDCGHIEEVSVLDRYMNRDSAEIKLKVCPHCKTVIRHNMRYGSVIKKTLKNIEVVKKICNENKDQVPHTKQRLMVKVGNEERNDENGIKTVMFSRAYTNTVAGLSALENQFHLLDLLKEVSAEYEKYTGTTFMNDHESGSQEADMFYKWLITPRQVFSEQEQYDAINELLRHRALLVYLACGQERQTALMRIYLPMLKAILLSGKPYTEEKQTRVKTRFQILGDAVPSDKVDQMTHTKVKLVGNVGPASGKWFSCKKGHVYSNGDQSVCPDCKTMKDIKQRRMFMMTPLGK
ncbi:NFX1-type zinc finger-containing protein 1-like [Haliotis asinina]|uniref:NFX1-type zinc finger-containing protein 1-like n=1 Tax=Haliotis asinina TaxID=109174 RepID=UPI0035326DA6